MADLHEYEVNIGKLTSKLGEYGQQLDAVKKKQEKLNKMLKEGTINEQAYQKATEALEKQEAAIKKTMDSTTEAIEKQNQAQKEAEKSAILAGAGVSGLAGNVKVLGTQLKAMLANPIIAILAAVVGILIKMKDAIAGNEELNDKWSAVMARFQPILDALSNAFDKVTGYVIDFVAWFSKLYQKFVIWNANSNPIYKPFKVLALILKDIVVAIIDGVRALSSWASEAGIVEKVTTAVGEAIDSVGEFFFNITKPVRTAIKAVADFARQIKPISKLIDKMLDLLGKSRAYLAEKWDTQLIDEDALEADQKKYEKLNAEEKQLRDDKRAWLVEQQKLQTKLNELESEYADQEGKTAAELKKIENDRYQIATKIAQTNYNLAKREYDLAVKKAALAGNSSEDNDQLANLEANVNQQSAAIEQIAKLHNKRLTALAKAEAARLKAELKERQKLEDTIRDYQIEQIDNVAEKEREKMKETQRRALRNLQEQYDEAVKDGKDAQAKILKDTIKLVETVNAKGLMSLNLKQAEDKFKTFGVDMAEIYRDVLTRDFFKELPKMIKDTEEDINNVNQKKLEEFVNNWSASLEELRKKFIVYNNEAFNPMSDPEAAKNYEDYLNEIYNKLKDISKVEPPFDESTQVEVELIQHHIGQITASLREESIQKNKLKKEEEELKKAEEERYRQVQANIVGATQAERERLETVRAKNLADVEKTVTEYYAKAKEALKDAAMSDEELNKAIKEQDIRMAEELAEKKADIEADIAASNEKLNAESNAKLKQAKLTHEESMKNIHLNSEMQQTLITEQEANKRRNIVIDSYQGIADATNDCFSTIASLYEDLANDENKTDEERQEAKEKAIKLQKAQAISAGATALAKGISDAMDYPFPANLVIMAGTIAAVMAQIATVIKLNRDADAIKRARGGYVSGAGSSTSDSINAKLSDGEYVVNARATKANLPLLNSINGNNGTSLVAQFAQALQMQKAPQVAVREVNEVNTRYNNVRAYSHL